MSTSHTRSWARWLAAVLAALTVGAYLGLTPGGVLTKADMVGYAVCHRIPSHSFFIGGRQLPLCARCTGTFLGALIGLLGQGVILRRRRASEFPPPPILALLVGFILLMGADGLNSYLSMIPGAPYLYEPRQWLRLVTGTLNGLALSGILLPLVHFSLWRDITPERVIRRWRDLGVLVALEGGMVGLVLTRWPPLLYPLALAGAAGVLTMLTLINTVLVVMLTGRENRYGGWREAIGPLLAGIALAFLEVGLIDLLRYRLTGTLEGFPGLG
ncbi:MAG TPA: DUF2085 domain-containing protein [Anaerolineales bacterium]|nr:DUF2085 domain-containing protein [Anaerolineales bacterium]